MNAKNLFPCISHLNFHKHVSFSDRTCVPADNNKCLLRNTNDEWSKKYRCKSTSEYYGVQSYCNSYVQDTWRCCPTSCPSGRTHFTEDECKRGTGSGVCVYSYSGQCHPEGTLSKHNYTLFHDTINPWHQHIITSNIFSLL